MSKNYFDKVQALTSTKFWINNVTREQAKIAIEAGACGCTQNPSFSWKMLSNDSLEEREYAYAILDRIMSEEKDNDQALVALQRELIGNVAKIFYPMYKESGAKKGFVSIQGNPFKENANDILNYALYNREAGENIMCKIPVVPGGIEAISELAKHNIPINATECMGIDQVISVCEAYEKATANLVRPMPIYFSVITGIFDEHLANVVARDNIHIEPDVLWYAGLAVAKKIYNYVKTKGYNAKFIGGGARKLTHFTEMVGADCQITINWKGTADKLIENNEPAIQRFWMPTPDCVIDELREKIPDFRKAYDNGALKPEEFEDFGPVVLFRSSFERDWKNALRFIEDRREEKKN